MKIFSDQKILFSKLLVFHYIKGKLLVEIIAKYGILISEWGDRHLNKTHLYIGKSYLAIIASSQNFKFFIIS